MRRLSLLRNSPHPLLHGQLQHLGAMRRRAKIEHLHAPVGGV